jgi:hypothetical protein
MNRGVGGAAIFRVLLALFIPMLVVAIGLSSYLHFHSVAETAKYSVGAVIGGSFLYRRLAQIGSYHVALTRARRARRTRPPQSGEIGH